MEPKTCADCTHFVKHYIKMKKRYFPINAGHCTYPRLKDRTTKTPACANFTDANQQQNA